MPRFNVTHETLSLALCRNDIMMTYDVSNMERYGESTSHVYMNTLSIDVYTYRSTIVTCIFHSTPIANSLVIEARAPLAKSY